MVHLPRIALALAFADASLFFLWPEYAQSTGRSSILGLAIMLLAISSFKNK